MWAKGELYIITLFDLLFIFPTTEHSVCH